MDADEFNVFAKKYGLPLYSEFSKILDLDDIEDPIYLKDLRKKFAEKFEYYSKLLENFFQPESDFSNFIETKFLGEDIKDEYFSAYKKFRYLIRESQLLGVYNDDEKDLSYIKDSISSWNELKPIIIQFLESLKKSWLESNSEDDARYFG